MAAPIYKGGSAFFKGHVRFRSSVCAILVKAGVPVNGTSGTGVNKAGPGSLLADSTGAALYVNVGTKASPTWDKLLSAAAAFTTSELIATGTTSATAAVGPTAFPAVVHANSTGVSDAGISLPVPAAGNYITIFNDQTGVVKLYSSGATINGTTGTTAFSLTATGNRMVTFTSTVAGAWLARGNT